MFRSDIGKISRKFWNQRFLDHVLETNLLLTDKATFMQKSSILLSGKLRIGNFLKNKR